MAIRLVAKDLLPNSRDKELHYIAHFASVCDIYITICKHPLSVFYFTTISDRKIIDYEFSTEISGHQEVFLAPTGFNNSLSVYLHG